MRNQWYGDNRDLVKWSVVLNLATERGLKRIVQVAMMRPTNWTGDTEHPVPHINRNGAPWKLLPDEAIAHFRDVNDIPRLANFADVHIDVVDEPFEHKNRASYFDRITARLQKPPRQPMLVFVDPDTGIAPRNPKAEHIRADELKSVYNAAPPGSTILLYQHARQRVAQAKWMNDTLQEFAAALSLPADRVEQYYSPDIAHDVAFLAAQKPKE